MPLPPGLSLNKLTGIISGTPQAAGTYTGTLRVRDSQGTSRDQPYSITIGPYDPPRISGAPSPYSTRTEPYSAQLVVADGVGPFVWSLSSGVLPTGLTLDPATGLISGTPTDTAYTDRNLTVRVVDAPGSSAQFSYTLRYRDRIATASAYPTAILDTAYGFTPVLVGGHAPITWALTGVLPVGLSFNVGTGRISGTPGVLATPSITVVATDAAGLTATIAQTFTVSESYVPVSLTGAITGTDAAIQQATGSYTLSPAANTLAASGGSGTITYSWARLSGSASIAAASPTSLTTGFNLTIAPGTTASAVFRLTATDGTTSATYDVTVSGTNTYVMPALIGSPSLYALQGKAYSSSFTRTGGVSPYSFVVTSGTLPTGLSLNGSTGLISGTPTDVSYTNRAITVRVTDGQGQQATGSYTLQYKQALALEGVPDPAYNGMAYSFTPTKSGGYTPYAFTLQAGALPAGMSLNGSTGTVSGTSGALGAANFTLRMTDAQGNIKDRAYTITVQAYVAPSINGSITGPATRSVAFLDSVGVSGGLAPFVYSLLSGSLPAGLVLNSSNGTVSGTPTDTNYVNFTCVLRVADALGNTSDTGTQTITYRNLPVMVGRALARRERTQAISESVASAAVGHTPFTYSIVAGSLPTGASLNAGTGAITGTLTSTAYANYSATIRATDALGNTQDGVYTLQYVNVVALTGGYAVEGEVTQSYAQSPTISGGYTPYTYTVQSGALPAGLALNTVTGQITGTPTTAGTPTTTIRATDGNGVTSDLVLNWTIYAMVTAGLTTPAATSGVPYAGGSVNGASGKAPLTYSIVAGALPTGLSLNASTGAITGTPTGATSGFTARVTDALGAIANVSGSITVAAAATVAIANRSVDALRIGAGTCNAGYELNSSGSANFTRNPPDGSNIPISGEWLLSGSAASYEAVVSITGAFGAGVTGPTGTLNLGTTRTWLTTQVANGSSGGTVNIAIRPAGGGATLASATINLSAERS